MVGGDRRGEVGLVGLTRRSSLSSLALFSVLLLTHEGNQTDPVSLPELLRGVSTGVK